MLRKPKIPTENQIYDAIQRIWYYIRTCLREHSPTMLAEDYMDIRETLLRGLQAEREGILFDDTTTFRYKVQFYDRFGTQYRFCLTEDLRIVPEFHNENRG